MAFHRQHLGEHFSEAARLLWKALERDGLTLGQATRRLDIHTGTISRWLYGDVVPDLQSAARVADEWPEIRVDLWTVSPTKAFTPPAARAEAS